MKLTLTEIIALIEAAEKLYGIASNAMNNSDNISSEDKTALVARIKAVQAGIPE